MTLLSVYETIKYEFPHRSRITQFFDAKLMQPADLSRSIPSFSNMVSIINQAQTSDFDMNILLRGFEPSSSIFSSESGIFSPSLHFHSSIFSDDYNNDQMCHKHIQLGSLDKEFQFHMEGLDPFGSDDADEVSMIWDDCFESFPSRDSVDDANGSSPCSFAYSNGKSTENASHILSSFNSAEENMDVDDQSSLFHLLKAYAEASEKEQTELMDVIQEYISEKASPLGETLERFSFNFFKGQDQLLDHLKQESQKNFEAAFKVFYKMLPFGRVAHFVSNSAILDSLPAEAETIHIIDFDMGEGVQWAPVIETLGLETKKLILTSIKWEEDDSCAAPSQYNFENTRKRLLIHAESVGLNLEVQKVDLEDLVSAVKMRNKRVRQRDWLAFNCQVGLPHMTRVRNWERVTEFLRVAKDLIGDSNLCVPGTRGIVTFGDGCAFDTLTRNSDYPSFFNVRLAHSQAFLYAMDWCFPEQLTEAKRTMECLFLEPHISSVHWLQQWKDIKEGCDLRADLLNMNGLKLSETSIIEARKLVKEGESSFWVRIGGKHENEMSLQWKGTPLVNLSIWG